MKNTIEIQARQFVVELRDERTEERQFDSIVLDKEQLKAAQSIGMSADELLYRLYNPQGFRVEKVHKPERKTLTVDLAELWRG